MIKFAMNKEKGEGLKSPSFSFRKTRIISYIKIEQFI